MKVYLYDTDSGMYLGEDYASEEERGRTRGVTAIAPPPYRRGETAMFEEKAQSWRILSQAEAWEGLPTVIMPIRVRI